MRAGLRRAPTLTLLLPLLTCHALYARGPSEGALVAKHDSKLVGLPASAPTNFTVLVNTFRRADCLSKVLHHWLSCSPGELRVTWSEGPDAVPSWLAEMESRGQLIVDRYPSNRLTNRFQPQAFANAALFTVDDDIYYSCDALQGAFREFQRDPRRIVGFAPRLLESSGYAHDGAYKERRANTLFVTKGAFLPRGLLTEYFSPEFQEQRQAVDSHTTAEDILMSFVYARKVGLPVVPLMVQQKHVHKLWPCGGFFGRQLMTRPGSNEIRHTIISSLFEAFGDPLRDLETKSFVDVATASTVDLAAAPVVDVIAGHSEMPHGGADYLVI